MVSKETDTNDAMGIGEGRGSPSARENNSKMPAAARMSRTDDQSAAKLKLATTNGAGLMMEVAIRCTVPSCSCECFTPGKMHVRYCDTCKHGWVPHALDKLGFRHLYHPLHGGGGGGGGTPSAALMSPHHGVEAVQPNVAFDIASLVLYGCQALPIRLKILLDRLFSVLQQEEVLQVLHGFGWTHEDYARGYVLTDPHGTVLERWNMCSREEEPLVLQQFLRFGETRAITQQLLSQESADLLLHAHHPHPPSPSLRALPPPPPPPPPPRIDSDIKKFIDRAATRQANKEESHAPPTSLSSPQPLSLTAGLHHVHHLHHQHLHQHHQPPPPSHRGPNRAASPPPNPPVTSAPPPHLHHSHHTIDQLSHHHHFPPHLQIHPAGASPMRPSVPSVPLLPPPHPSQPLSFPKMPPMPSVAAINGPPSTQLSSPVTPTSPLSVSPLNRLQSMQPFDFRKDRIGACPPGGSPEPVPPSPIQQQPPPPPPPPPVRRRPSVASDSGPGLNLSVQANSPTRVPPPVTSVSSGHYLSSAPSSAGQISGPGGFKSDVSGSEYGGSDDENSVSALNLSRDRAGDHVGVGDERRRSHHHHARKATTPVKRQWNPLNLGTQLINPSTGKKRVQCNVCLKTFCDKGALKIHFSAVHLREMHRCTVEGCNMMFSSRRSRNRHSANPNPKLHSPHLRRKISPHDGRSSQPHPLLMAPPHHQTLGGLPAAAAAALSPALAGLGAAGPFNAMAAAAAAGFPLLATPPPGEMQRASEQHAHQTNPHSHQHSQNPHGSTGGMGGPPASLTSSSASSPSSDLKYSLDLSVHRYGDGSGRRTDRGQGAGVGSSSSSSDVDDMDDEDDDLDDEDDMAFSSHTNHDGDDEDCDDEDDVGIFLDGRSRRRRRHGERRPPSRGSDVTAPVTEERVRVVAVEDMKREVAEQERPEEITVTKEAEVKMEDDRKEKEEVRGKRDLEVGEEEDIKAEQRSDENSELSSSKRFKRSEVSDMDCDGECSPLRESQPPSKEEDEPPALPPTPVTHLTAENGPPSATSSSSWKAGVRKRKSRNPTRCAQPLPEERTSHVVMSSSEDDLETTTVEADGGGEEVYREPSCEEEECQPECLKVEAKVLESPKKEEIEEPDGRDRCEDIPERENIESVKKEEELPAETMDLSKNEPAEEKKSQNENHDDEIGSGGGERDDKEGGRFEEREGDASRTADGDCPSTGVGNSDGDESLDSSHALRQLENLSHGHFGESNARVQHQQAALAHSLLPGTPASALQFPLGLPSGCLTSPPSPARSSSDRGDRDRDAESLSNPDSPSGDSSQQGLSHFRDASGFMGAVDVPIDKENPRRCPLCGKIFQNHFGVKTHYQNVHLKLMHKCTVDGCNAAFPSKRSRDRHSANLNLHRKLLSTSSSDKLGGVFGDKSPFASLAANPALHGEFLARLYADSQALPLNLEAFKSHLPAAGTVPAGIGGLAEHLMVNGDRLGTGGLPPPPLLLPSLGFAGFGGLDHFGAALAAGMNGGRGPNSSASSGSPSPSPPMPLSLLRHPLAPESGSPGSRPSPSHTYYCLEEDDPTPEADGGLRCRFCHKAIADGASLKEHYERLHISEMFGCTVEGCSKAFSSRQRRNLHSQNEAAHTARPRNTSPSPPPDCS